MWIRIRAVIIEDESLAAEYLAVLLDETCQVEVVGSATESETGLRLCAELPSRLLKSPLLASWLFVCRVLAPGLLVLMKVNRTFYYRKIS